jgi:hypothetical protein
MGNRRICGRFNRSHTHLEDSRRSEEHDRNNNYHRRCNRDPDNQFDEPTHFFIYRPWRFFEGSETLTE